ncbi:MAG: transglutaminase family protein, partial [Pirellulaceae bacterium]|nr:transglutaminase family protein [Pirellulaceae bacterium]
MKTIHVGSRLQYDVQSPSTFLLNVSVALNDHQSTIDESITVEPFYKVEQCAIGSLQNRLLRLSADPGPLTIEYRA